MMNATQRQRLGMGTNFHRGPSWMMLSVVGLAVVVLVSVGGGSLSHRGLRFFDPDHRTCGDERQFHDFAVAVHYGVKDRDYYNRTTITTDEELSEDKATVNRIFRALAYIAIKTERPIRVNQEIHRGYNSEHRQPYSVIDVVALDSIGAQVVEPGYWNRARTVQEKDRVRRVVVDLGEDPLGTLSGIENDPDADEMVFSTQQLLQINHDALGHLVGVNGGYDGGKWVKTFVCLKEHTNPNAIPPGNDRTDMTV